MALYEDANAPNPPLEAATDVLGADGADLVASPVEGGPAGIVVAAAAGFSIPLLLKRMHIDPAIAGGVVLTTVTDVIGYMAFLGLGAVYLL